MKFWKYFFILLIVPLLFIGGGYGIVKLLNASISKASPIQVEVDRDLLLPWQQEALATMHLDFEGFKKRNKKVGKANIVLIIDNSGSMGAGKGSRFEIARVVIGNFVDNFSAGLDTRMGVILFDSDVTQKIPLTVQYEELKQKLFSFNASGGGTNFLPPLELAYQWLEPSIQSNSMENNFVIFLTDGGADALGPNRFYRDKFLPNSVILFCIGVGKGALYENLVNILRDENGNVPPNRVLTCDDPLKLQFVYDQVGEQIGNVVGKQGQMAIPFSYKSFEWFEADVDSHPGWKSKKGSFLLPPEKQDAVHFLNWPIIFARKYTCHIPVDAETFGIIKPFYDEVPFRFFDIDGQRVQMESKRIPYLLNITWLLLFLFYLPLLLFVIARIFQPRHKTKAPPQEETLLVLGDREKRPGVLPKQHIHERSEIQWIPSFIIGLGHTGRHVLTHLKQDIDDLMSGDVSTVRLLSIDVAHEEVFGAHPDNVPGTIVTLDRDREVYIPEEHLRNVKDLVDRYKDNPAIQVDDPLTALDMKEYAKLPDSVLGLSGGTHHNPALARAYLVKELEMDDESLLLQRLQDTIEQLKEDAGDSRFVQIFIVASSNGGTGSGLISDLAVLMRRLADRKIGKDIAVEINLAIVEDRIDFDEPGTTPILNRVLLDELDCISQAGRVYQPYNLVREHCADNSGVLKGMLTCKPHNNVYTFARQTREPRFDLFPEVADDLFFFIERTARIETRQFIDSIRQQEGQIRKDRKIESVNAMTGRAIMFPTRFIEEYLKILFVSDIFSDRIALKGLNADEDSLAIQPHGTVADLYDRPSSNRIFNLEYGNTSSVWTALLKGEDVERFLEYPAAESEQFIYFLQKTFTTLLNEGVYSLTGMEQAIDELHRRCTAALNRFIEVQNDTASEIENVIAFLNALKENLLWWIIQLLGKDDTEGLVQHVRKIRTRLEKTKEELLKMNRCRVVLGLDDKAPQKYHFNGLREQWIAWWLNIEDTADVYHRLKERCIWTIAPQDLLKPDIIFEFLGHNRHIFTSQSPLIPQVMEETDTIAAQFLVKLKDITIMEILAEYEKTGTSRAFTLRNLAEQFHTSNRSPNLFYIHLFPHHSRIRLSPTEEQYIRRLKEELDNIKYPYEQFLYPPSSNQYKIFSIQVSYLLQGNYKKPYDSFKPVHLPELLKKENHLTLRKQYDIDCEKEIPYYYLLFYHRLYFQAFARMWLAGRIYLDSHDRLWKLDFNGNTYKLTFIDSETIIDAAVHFVLSRHLPFVAFDASAVTEKTTVSEPKPDKKRLNQLHEEVRDNNTFYCWMKLYLEGGES
jgi:hypothetical protein